jgi:hypothetical protein
MECEWAREALKDSTGKKTQVRGEGKHLAEAQDLEELPFAQDSGHIGSCSRYCGCLAQISFQG